MCTRCDGSDGQIRGQPGLRGVPRSDHLAVVWPPMLQGVWRNSDAAAGRTSAVRPMNGVDPRTPSAVGTHHPDRGRCGSRGRSDGLTQHCSARCGSHPRGRIPDGNDRTQIDHGHDRGRGRDPGSHHDPGSYHALPDRGTPLGRDPGSRHGRGLRHRVAPNPSVSLGRHPADENFFLGRRHHPATTTLASIHPPIGGDPLVRNLHHRGIDLQRPSGRHETVRRNDVQNEGSWVRR